MRIPLPQPGQKKCSEFLADIRQRPWHGGNNAGIKTSDMIVEAAVRNACLAETFIRRDQVSEAFLRSEEHTSELQSLMRISYAVFCLNKKNNSKHIHNITAIV